MDIDIRHLSDLEPVTRADYEAAVEKALAGRALARLQAVTLDGIAVPWIGTPRQGALPVSGRAAGAPWSIVQKVALDDPAAANAEILGDLAGGVDGIDLVLPADGLPDQAMLARALDGVHLDMAAVHLTGVLDPRAALDLMAAISRHPRERLRLRAGFDPFAAAIAEGGDFAAAFARKSAVARAAAAAEHPGDTMLLAARGEAWHALGASDATQLAILTAAGAAYLSDALEAGADAARLGERIEFRIAADQNQFATMARLRAFRRLWALVLDGFGLPQAPAFVHAEAAYRMATRRDPWVNILRSTIAAFAAAVAGADAITTLPHTALLGRPDAAARRLSRNVQTVLMDEATLHRVADPAAGAGGLEDLTDALAEKGWEAFQALERQGGLAAALSSGTLQAAIAETDAREHALVARRRLPIIGTSIWPLIAERDASVLAGPPLARPPLPGARRLAEPFEALRDASDAALAAHGQRPRLFLATLGPVSAHGARATWAKALFEAGGIEVVGGDPYPDVLAAIAAFAGSGAPGACLVGDDGTYAESAATGAAGLAAAGARIVALAGRPPEGGGTIGVGSYVHEGLDMVETLGALQAVLTLKQGGG